MSADYASQSFNRRGESMTRIETFVAASFAFAVTMLVISLGTIPSNFAEFMTAVKNIPSYVLSCAIIFQIWHSHADWSRNYGLEDIKTVVLSGALVCIVLVYIYPLRLMMQGLFAVLSNGYFPFELEINSLYELRFLFAFYALGFFLLSINFLALFAHSLKQKKQLALNTFEQFQTERQILHWQVISAICGVIFVITILLPGKWFFFSPYLFTLIFPANIFLAKAGARKWERLMQDTKSS